MKKAYKIIRTSKNGNQEIIADGLTLRQAKKYGDDIDTIAPSDWWVGRLFSEEDGIETLNDLNAAVARKKKLEQTGKLDDEWNYLRINIQRFAKIVADISSKSK